MLYNLLVNLCAQPDTSGFIHVSLDEGARVQIGDAHTRSSRSSIMSSDSGRPPPSFRASSARSRAETEGGAGHAGTIIRPEARIAASARACRVSSAAVADFGLIRM